MKSCDSFASSHQKKEEMFILVVLALFVAAIVAPFVLPNKKVSTHEKDWEVD